MSRGKLVGEVKRLGFRVMERLASQRGYELIRPERATPPEGWTCLNVGSGGQALTGFTNLDVPSEHYDAGRTGAFLEYDMRTDELPYPDASVDLIYCSHVIEHVEDEHVARFFKESARVLRDGGVLRVACPDASFLHQVSAFPNSYWTWRWPHMERNGIDPGQLQQVDFLMREVCTTRFHESLFDGRRFDEDTVSWTTSQASIELDLDRMTQEQQWSRDQIGHHINWWSFEKVVKFAAGDFRYVVRSRYRGSVSRYMRTHGFDLTCPEMSLYVDLVR